jgi:hypothetical protein
MKVIFALQVVLMQCMWVDAAMYKTTEYSTTTCTAGTEKESEWVQAEICGSTGDGTNYAKAMCSGGSFTYTIYSDSACNTVNTSWTNTDPNSALVANNGVITVTGCQVQGSKGEILDCTAAQPASVSFNVFTDAGCATAHTTPTMSVAINACEYDLDGLGSSGTTSSQGSTSNTAGNTTGGRRLLQAVPTPFGRKLSTTSIAEKSTWDSTTNKVSTQYYSDKTCQTAVGSPELKDFGSDACVMVGSNMYYKFTSFSPVVSATASGCGRMQSLFLLPLLVFLGVTKMMMML